MEKKKKEKIKTRLTGAQEVTYQHEFKMADRAAGFIKKKNY
ncbi:YfhE family protein [Peribacillus tepidiphilus]|nr:YfhE family protein [Peribacillus tepidiphilus]